MLINRDLFPVNIGDNIKIKKSTSINFVPKKMINKNHKILDIASHNIYLIQLDK